MSHLMGRSFTNPRLLACLAALGVCVLTILVYRPAWHGGFIWDDDRYVTHNYLLTAPDGLRQIWFSLESPSQYFPLSYTVLRIERSLWGLNPTGYHWVSLFFHIANAFLVWRVLCRLRVPGSWLAAAVFALHPVQVESVAWISEMKNLLMGFFFLLTLLAWIEYADATGKRRRVFYLAALSFSVLALFAKSTACTLPAALFLILWLRSKPIGRCVFFEIAPFVVFALVIGLLTVWWEKYHQGTRVLVALGPVERVLIASRAIWFYLSKIFWPSDLTFIYPRWQIDVANPLAYLGLIAAIGAAVLIYYGRRWFGRGVEVATVFFVATLSPLLGFIMLYTFRYTFVADHYQYLASIAPIALASAGLMWVGDSMRQARWLVPGVSFIILAFLGALSWRQSFSYRDLETLWRTTIDKNPSCWMAYNNLGVLQFQKGDLDDAIEEYERSLRLNPDYPEAHYNLGGALLQKGQIDEAMEHSRKALQLQPNDSDAHVVLGNVLMAKRDIDGAINEYARALALRPEDSNAHYNLATALGEKGEFEQAAREYERAREFEPRGEP